MPDPAPAEPAPAAGRHVVLVHGYLDRPGVFWRMDRILRRKGWVTHAITLRPSSGRCGLAPLARQLQAYVAATLPAGGAFDLVGFSMGGLVARYYLQRLDGLERVRRLITIATPHHGTRVAYVFPGRGCAEMRPGSAFLDGLNADVGMLAPVSPVSIWTPFDLTINPSTSAVLPVGRNERVPVVQHTLMLWSRAVLRVVGEALEGTVQPPSPRP